MIPVPAGCARFLGYGWFITAVCFVVGPSTYLNF